MHFSNPGYNAMNDEVAIFLFFFEVLISRSVFVQLTTAEI